MIRYQETWVAGQSQEVAYQRSCADRYAPIKEFLSQYRRRFSVFDLGASMGYFDFRIMEDNDAVCVMADNREGLLDLIELNKAKDAIWLNRRFDTHELWYLGECESFDVVLALSVLHHFGAHWKNALDALLTLGSYIIAELPAADDEGAINGELGEQMRAYVESLDGARLLAEFESHTSGKPRPMFLIPSPKSEAITRQSIDALDRGAPPLKDIVIQSTFREKSISILHGDVTGKIESRDFFHGMNLWNFHLLNGAWPNGTREMVVNWARESAGWHDDLRPWNFILGGDHVHAIDTNNKDWRIEPEPGGLDTCLKLLARGHA